MDPPERLVEQWTSKKVCHPEQSEGPWFLPVPSYLPARVETEVPPFARDDNRATGGVYGNEIPCEAPLVSTSAL